MFKIRAWIAAHRHASIVLSVSVIVNIVSFMITIWSTHMRGLDMTILGGDDYRLLAENLLRYGSFSFSTHQPLLPDSVRVPGYPLVLAIMYVLARNWIIVLFIQSLLLSFSPIILYSLAKRFGERLAYVASLLFALEPTRPFWSGLMMTDGMFTLLLLLAIWVFFRLLDASTAKRALATGLLLGLLTLIRPVGFLVWPIFLFAVLWHEKWKPAKTFLATGALILAGFASLIVPWAIRNKILFNTYQLSAIGDYSFAYANAIQFKKYKTGAPLAELIAEYNARVPQQPREEQISLKHVSIYRNFAWEIIGADIRGYMVFHVVKTIPLFVTDGLRGIVDILGILPSGERIPNLSGAFLRGQFFSVVVDYVREQPLQAALLFIGSTFWFFVSLGFFLGFLLVLRYERGSALRDWTFLFLVSAYFLAVASGPVAQPRYRLPVEGLLFLFALYALTRFPATTNNGRA